MNECQRPRRFVGDMAPRLGLIFRAAPTWLIIPASSAVRDATRNFEFSSGRLLKQLKLLK
jgi:hypothetical protein